MISKISTYSTIFDASEKLFFFAGIQSRGPVKVQSAFGIFMSVAAVWLTFIWDTKENIFPEQLSSKPYSIIKIETITD